MTRTRSNTTALLLFILALATSANASDVKKPNFVVIIADDHGVLHSSPYGQPEYQTPQMQRMADEGIRLTNAYVASPTCGPSRAALCTGLVPYRNGIKANAEHELRPGVESLFPLLAAQGYEILFRGKIGHGRSQPYVSDDVQRFRGSNRPKLKLDEVDEYLATRDASRPVALFLGPTYTHRSWPDATEARMQPEDVIVPARTFDTPETRLEMTRYAEAVERTDQLIGDARAMATKHLPVDNTLILYTSDHGQSWPFGKWTLYESGIRTPMLAVWPGKIPAGVTNDAMVSWIDLLPTLIDFAGGEVPHDIDGRSLASVLLNESTTHRDFIFASYNGDSGPTAYPMRSVRVGNWKYIRNLQPEAYYTTALDIVRRDRKPKTPNWPSWIEAAKTNDEAAAFLRAYHTRPAEELFRIDTDPNETENLASSQEHADKLAELRAMVTERMKRVGDDGRVLRERKPRRKVDRPDPPAMAR